MRKITGGTSSTRQINFSCGGHLIAILVCAFAANNEAQVSGTRGNHQNIFDSDSSQSDRPSRPIEIPNDADQAASEKIIRELYRDEFNAQSGLSKRQLASRLLAQGVMSSDDRSGQYMLFKDAVALSTEAEDLENCINAVQELSRRFNVDGLRMDATAITHFANSSNNDCRVSAVYAGLSLADAAIVAKHLDILPPVLKAIDLAARRSNDTNLIAQIREKVSAVENEVQSHVNNHEIASGLLANSDDPELNLRAGRVACFRDGAWMQGLPLLAKGSDKILAEIATHEMNAKETAIARADVAEAWYQYLQRSNEKPQKIGEHCLKLYESSVDGVPGLRKLLVKKRIDQLKMDASGEKQDSAQSITAISSPIGSCVFVCDASGSMLVKMVQLKDDLRARVAALRSEDQFNIIFFSDPDTVPNALESTLVAATDDNKKRFRDYLLKIKASGSTDPIPAIKSAIAMRPRRVVLETDGDFEDNAKVLSLIESLNPDHHIRFDAIVFTDQAKADQGIVALMERITSETGGMFSYREPSQ